MKKGQLQKEFLLKPIFAMILLLLNVLLNVISEDDDDKDGKDNDIKKI